MKGLLVAYWFPPKESIATQRTESFYKYFNENGIVLDVICPDWGIQKNIQPNSKIITTHKVNNGIFKFERNLKTKIKEFIFYRIFKYNYFRDSRKGSFFQHAVKELNKLNLDDYDFIITSYNPVDVLHIGEFIKLRNKKIKWIIDYRDYYSLNHYMDFGIFRPYFKKLEKRITKQADAFITVSETLKKNIHLFIEKEGSVIYNGYEIPKINTLNPKISSHLSSLPIISYCGSLYNGKRDISGFFDFYSKCRLDEKYQFIFALLDEKDERLVKYTIQKYNLKNVTIFTNLSHADSLSIMESSKFLMLFSDNHPKSNGFLSGKIFEYMPFKKPVIYSGKTFDYELYELIKSTDIGENFSEFDFENKKEYSFLISDFHRKVQAQKLIEFILEIMNRK